MHSSQFQKFDTYVVVLPHRLMYLTAADAAEITSDSVFVPFGATPLFAVTTTDAVYVPGGKADMGLTVKVVVPALDILVDPGCVTAKLLA